MIHSSKDEKKFIVSTIQANIKLIECSRRGYMNAPEEYIVLLHIRMQFKVSKNAI